jgi:hypothetical protein
MSLGRIVVLLSYTTVAFRTAYGRSWWVAVGRTLAVFVTYVTLVGLAFFAIVGWAMASLIDA